MTAAPPDDLTLALRLADQADAVTVERDGKPPREVKIGTFKLDGLKDVRLAGNSFVPNTLFEPTDEKYAGNSLMAVETR